MQQHAESDLQHCPVAKVQKIIWGKWSMVIIYFLSREPLRFRQLKRKMPQVTEASLTKELRMLEQYGLVHREVYREVPPHVEYSLTEIGRKLLPVLEALEQWALEYEREQATQASPSEHRTAPQASSLRGCAAPLLTHPPCSSGARYATHSSWPRNRLVPLAIPCLQSYNNSIDFRRKSSIFLCHSYRKDTFGGM